MTEQITVAIIGGSVAGLTLARGLLQYPQISFRIFEKRTTVVRAGAGLSIGPNGLKALVALGLPVENMLKEGGAFLPEQVDVVAGHGEHKGERLFDITSHSGQKIHHHRWLEQLLNGLLEDSVCPGKALQSIIRQESGTCLFTFEDGCSYEADVVFGCDGIHSRLRPFVLSDHEDKIEPVFAGLWDAHGEISTQDAADKFGTELINIISPRSFAIVGEEACIMFNPYDDGAAYRIILSGFVGPDFDPSTSKKTLTREFLEPYFGSDETLREGVFDLLLSNRIGSGIAFSQHEHPDAPTYVKDCVCLVGDAAHAVVPWMAEGVCLASEDCAVLSALLGAVSSKAELPTALKVYDQVRRPRTQKVRVYTRENAKLLCGGYGVDPRKIAELDVESWYEYVAGIDMEAHIDEALQLFRSSR